MIKDLRKDYNRFRLLRADLYDSPFEMFESWFTQAINSGVEEANICMLSTADKNFKVSSRLILLKGFDKNGFVFYTNYNSIKGKALSENPNAALVFWWPQLERQVRIEGLAEKTTAEESDEYFNSRPYESRLAAIISQQSSIVENDNILTEDFEALSKELCTDMLKRPPHWGGYIIKPERIEFWQGRPGRLHDRFEYLKNDNDWIINRLAP